MLHLVSLLILLTLGGCALTIDYKIPAHRFMDPETRGYNLFKDGGSGFIQMSAQADHTITMSSVYTFGVFGDSINEDQALTKSGNLGGQAGIGILERFDLQIRGNLDSPAMVIGKWQILGDTLKTQASGWKLAVWGGYGTMGEESSLTVTADDNTKRDYKGELDVTATELGLSCGYRSSPAVISYINFTYANYDAKSVLTSTTNPTVNVDGVTTLKAINLGFKLGEAKGISTNLELGGSQVKWTKGSEISQDLFSAGFTVNYGL
jgi:hypothetical protein